LPRKNNSLPILTVNKRHARAVLASFADALQVTIKEVVSPNLEALLDHLGGILVHAVLGGEPKNVVGGATTIWWSSMFADVLDAPVAELAMGYDINTGEHLVDAGTLPTVSMFLKTVVALSYLILLEAVLEDILHYQATCLAQRNLVPHPSESLIDVAHNLWWGVAPTKLEQLLPDVTSVAVDDSLWDTTKELMDHGSFVFLRY
jgi:hypothetical protein